MSAHYSKFRLNTYAMMPYFMAQVPSGYPLFAILQKCRAFRRLPPNLRKLSAEAKRWAMRKFPEFPAGTRDIEKWYDSAGYELDSATGRRLTDEEVAKTWAAEETPRVDVTDLDIPLDGFPDPDTWEEPAEEPTGIFQWGRFYDNPDDIPTEEQLMGDISSRGREWASSTYGISTDHLPGGTSEKAEFRRRVAKVLDSPYFLVFPPNLSSNKLAELKRRRGEEYDFLVEALEGADTRDDLGGASLTIFDQVESYDRKYDREVRR